MEKIHRINNSGWVDFRNNGNCTGSGTYLDPYFIGDLVINGKNSGNCIWIENSNVYFRIENCIIYNSGLGYYPSYNAEIKLINVSNSQLTDNNYSYNIRCIYLEDSYNNSITENTATNSKEEGIFLYYSNSKKVSGNTANNNVGCEILINTSDNNTISGNAIITCEYA